MHVRKFERVALATSFLVACVAFLGVGGAIEQARAQGTNAASSAPAHNPARSAPPPFVESTPSMPPPTFNPSSPYTVPQSPETPVSPASPGSIFGSSPSDRVN
jgi:hypothetical protein